MTAHGAEEFDTRDVCQHARHVLRHSVPEDVLPLLPLVGTRCLRVAPE